PYGGSAAPAIVQRIEANLLTLDRSGPRAPRGSAARIETVDLVTPYLERLQSMVRLERIRASGRRFVIDPLYGAGQGCIARLFEDAGIPYREIHGERNPLFPGLHPDPIEPHVAGLRAPVFVAGYDAV